MALKHLLNHDDSNEVYQNHHSFLSWSDHDPLSECIPTLPTQPWEQCVSEILGSQSLRYDMVQEEVETDLFESLEEANSLIKSWATGHPPCQTTVEDASQGQAYICYGTLVRPPIKLCGDMMVLSRKLNNCTLAPIQGHTQMVVTKIESQHVIAFSDGVVAGEVNAQLEKALCGIAE
ncbi:hypothetical protein AA0117_g12127 [Alternaria alternata]|uniref:Uncharacterized protein n=1 Tax=Alternaria alternata TaxID=5599 RepID=A0A4Q4N1H0_ALTAL|nr:hypothetical protein AA0117_g12127 [Alternaria alternata]